MDRKILFRGKCSHCDAWAYGSFVDYGDDEIPEIHGFDPYREEEKGEEEWREVPVDSWTVGQFTGLYDKTGKEIFEDDIVYSEFNDGSHAKCLVGWNEKEAGFGIMDEYSYRSKLKGYDFPMFDSDVLYHFLRGSKIFEVIGNIHDNPKLLEDG